jgi:molybdopterin converting factor small subunit
MQVNFYATFRLHAGMKTLMIDLPVGTTMRQAVDAIVKKIPALKADWITKKGELHAHVHGFINGVDVATLPNGWSTPLKPEDVLDFLPPVAGG